MKGILLLFCVVVSFASHGQNWFEFQPKNDFQAGEIGLANWLDAPAGKHGFVQNKGQNLVFEDGTPAKFWGVNTGGDDCYPEKATAIKQAEYWAKYGINAVRLHKFTWDEHQHDTSTVMKNSFWEKFDFFHQQLRTKGIYTGWSHIYGHKVQRADSAKMLNYGEIRGLKYPWSHLNGTTSALVNFAPDLQDLNIALTVNMLNHRNPNTGLRYADDPALGFVELQNEDNIFWSAIEEALKQAPSYRKLLCEQFADWLKTKYQTDENLQKAWGNSVLKPNEGISVRNVYPQPNHGLFGWEYETAAKEKRPMKRDVLDKITFLYEQQNAFYARFIAAIRATGYRGVIVGSCWQAGSGVSHYYNLYADYQAGIIDRHNYFGGDTGHNLVPGKVNPQSMLEVPGSGLLSTGLQQVEDRPFAFSEWICTLPNEWIAEGTPLVALYGMGLQGWDASYHFASNKVGFSKGISADWGGVYNVDSPLQIGLYPALARMLYRGDIKEAKTISTRNIHLPSLADGKLGFLEKVSQQFDIKEFDGDVKMRNLAIGKVVAKFSDSFQPIKNEDISGFDDGQTITSITGQLRWKYGNNPFVTLNTPASKAIIGFTENKKIDFGECFVRVSTPFAIVLITASEKDKTLTNSKKWLITTVARAKNTGMEYSADRKTLIQTGKPPLLLEPVDFSLTLPRKAVLSILDHDGMATNQKLPLKKGDNAILGNKFRAVYYTITFL